MTSSSSGIVHHTFVIERNFPKPLERVFAAFADPVRKRRWYAEGDHKIEQYEMNFGVGGSEKLRYRFHEGHPIAGSQIEVETIYQDIVPEKRIVMTTKMSMNAKPIEVMVTSFEFLGTPTGTDLVLTHQGTFIEWPQGPGMIEEGWRALLEKLAQEAMN
jgi:uncharacterized protein YndB with AHSA1/START domain